MAKKILQSISVRLRDVTGKKSTKRLRSEGLVPCILYGDKIEPMALCSNLKEINSVVRHSSIITLNIEDDKSKTKTTDVQVKDIQFDYLSTNILHIDFQQVRMDKEITAEVEIKVVGHAEGIDHGGQLDLVSHQIEIRCLPRDLPDEIVIDVTALNIGDSIAIGDISLPSGVSGTFTDPHITIVHVQAPNLEEEVEEAEEAGVLGEPSAGEPEVITKGKSEEDAE